MCQFSKHCFSCIPQIQIGYFLLFIQFKVLSDFPLIPLTQRFLRGVLLNFQNLGGFQNLSKHILIDF